MTPPLITLTTDFGTGSPYVAQMKAVLSGRIPDVRLVDVTHTIPPQDVTAAAVVLADTLKWFPAGTAHVAVVDPGVGTERRILAGRCEQGWFVGPDNGVFSLCRISDIVALENPQPWLSPVSDTFHGRDVMSPVAAWLASGQPLAELGPPVTDWVRLQIREPVERDGETIGSVIHIDSFGNLITNLTARSVSPKSEVRVNDQPLRRVRCYGDASTGEVVALIGSGGRLEIAVVNGSAAERFGHDLTVSIVGSARQS